MNKIKSLEINAIGDGTYEVLIDGKAIEQSVSLTFNLNTFDDMHPMTGRLEVIKYLCDADGNLALVEDEPAMTTATYVMLPYQENK